MTVDAHFHIWQIARGDYDWLEAEDPSLSRDFDVADWWEVARRCGVTQGILVQATPTAAETRFLQEVASRHPEHILGVAGWCDFDSHRGPADIEQLSTDATVLSVRVWLQAIDDPDWLDRPRVRVTMEALSRTRLRMEALIRPHHLPGIIDLARRHPQMNIVVDHGAKPELGSSIGFELWRRALHELADSPNVTCKLSGLLTEGDPQQPHREVSPYVDAILEGFGPTRTFWGSDWPVVTTRASYQEWYDLARASVPLDCAEDVFRRSAFRAYGLKTPDLREETEA